MAKKFNSIALMGRQNTPGVTETLSSIISYLEQHQLNIAIDDETATLLDDNAPQQYPRTQLAKHCDLIIVVGGDGSLLNAAQIAVDLDTPVLGINRGKLGFLTDIKPDELEKIGEVLDGKFREEPRLMLQATTDNAKDVALNDVALLSGEIAQMIDFALYINKQFVCNYSADGLLIATPTGSTAHALSGGGPIIQPNLDVLTLVPMFSHNLSSRPIVISSDSDITIELSANNRIAAQISCDGREREPVAPGGKIKIKKHSKQLRLIHPLDYHYFDTLRMKLNWQNK